MWTRGLQGRAVALKEHFPGCEGVSGEVIDDYVRTEAGGDAVSRGVPEVGRAEAIIRKLGNISLDENL